MPRLERGFFHFKEVFMCWLALLTLLAPLAGVGVYRHAFGKWPLRLDL